ncbi:MAG: hypothetical protein HRU20_02970 [Pseudomonadales bacterium]|nr:hypothetical protein [Pseudomonadales bacterium]
MKKLALASVSVIGLALVGCGSNSDDSGSNINTDAAQITSETSQDLAIAATHANSQAISSEGLPQQRSKTSSSSSIVENSTRLLVTSRESIDGICDTGSVDVNIDESGNGSFTYNNCSISSITMNGVVNITTANEGDEFTAEYSNFTVTSGGETHSFDNFTFSCTGLTTDSFTCTSSTGFTADGVTYRLEEFTVNGDNVSGTIYHEEHGYVMFSASNMSYGCDNGRPQTGTIEISGSEGSSASVIYNDCSSYTVVFDGNSTIYNW